MKQRKSRQRQNKQKRGSKKFSLSKKIFVLIVALLVLLLILLLVQFGFFNYVKGFFGEVEHVSIVDNCVPILGNLVHQVKNDGDCKIRCLNECKLMEKDYNSHEFVYNSTYCHTCDCYCK